jgi:hypothetical protein
MKNRLSARLQNAKRAKGKKLKPKAAINGLGKVKQRGRRF